MKRNIVLVVLAYVFIFSAHAESTPEKFLGTWTGSWRGESASGQVSVTFSEDVKGSIRFSNLESFGEVETSLSALRFLGNRINFLVRDDEGRDLDSYVFLIGGNRLKGSATYDGETISYRLSRQ